MWMDGIITEKNKKRRRPATRRKQAARKTFTVSARTREIRAERRRRVTLTVLILVILSGFGVFGAIGVQALFRSLFSENDKYVIRNWEIHTDGLLLTPDHIRQYANLGDYENLFAINLNRILRELEKTPAISSARVERRLPDTLIIHVNERLALARLQLDQPVPLAIAADGQVLGPSSLRPNLPVIRGIQDDGLRPGIRMSASYLQDALTILELAADPQIHPHLRVRAIDIAHDEFVTVELMTGEEVLIDRSHITPRMFELASILQDQRRRGRTIARINMTGYAHIPPVMTPAP